MTELPRKSYPSDLSDAQWNILAALIGGEASAEGSGGLCGDTEALGGGAFVCVARKESTIE